jgi:hypothetical protein
MSEKVESHIFARGVYFTLQENRPVKGAKARSSPLTFGTITTQVVSSQFSTINMCGALPSAPRRQTPTYIEHAYEQLACVGDIVLKLSRFQRKSHASALGRHRGSRGSHLCSRQRTDGPKAQRTTTYGPPSPLLGWGPLQLLSPGGPQGVPRILPQIHRLSAVRVPYATLRDHGDWILSPKLAG